VAELSVAIPSWAYQSLLLSQASPGCVLPPVLSLYPLITTDNYNSTLQLVLTTVSTAALFVIVEEVGTTRALYSMEYSEAIKKNEQDLNVLLGSDLQDISFVEKTKQHHLVEQQIECIIPLVSEKSIHTHNSGQKFLDTYKTVNEGIGLMVKTPTFHFIPFSIV